MALNARVARGSRGINAQDHIAIMIPYWVYRRVCDTLVAMGVTTKPEDYIIAILEGHVRRLNL